MKARSTLPERVQERLSLYKFAVVFYANIAKTNGPNPLHKGHQGVVEISQRCRLTNNATQFKMNYLYLKKDLSKSKNVSVLVAQKMGD